MSKLRRGLMNRLTGPARLPQFYALSGFIEASSPWTAADPLEVLVRLHRVVGTSEDALPFDRFVPWAKVVLDDFAAVDHELADVGKVFQNLADIQGIEDWSFGEETWSEDQKAFERQWRRLPELYAKLHANLGQDGLATRAHLTRKLAEGEGHLDVDHVLAAGLATMSTAEWKCLDAWNKTDRLTVLWDADPTYVHDVHNEAGLFIRKFRSPNAPLVQGTLASQPPIVRVVGCASTVLQTQHVRDILANLTPEQFNQTLVVLPDGGTLGTLLQALPSNANGLNVTMGLAMHETPVLSFVDQVFTMLETTSDTWRLEQLQAFHAHPVMHHIQRTQGHHSWGRSRHARLGQSPPRLGECRRLRRTGRPWFCPRREAARPASGERSLGLSRSALFVGTRLGGTPGSHAQRSARRRRRGGVKCGAMDPRRMEEVQDGVGGVAAVAGCASPHVHRG